MKKRVAIDDPLRETIQLNTARSIQDYLGVPEHWPVVEKIGYSIVLMPNAADIKTAVRQDPRACALHNAACRQMNIPSCAIGARYAYIPQRDAKGRPFIARMQTTQATHDAILKFDRTGKMPEGGFIFQPVAPAKRLAYVRKYEEKWSPRRTPQPNTGRVSKRRAPLRAIPHAFSEKDKT